MLYSYAEYNVHINLIILRLRVHHMVDAQNHCGGIDHGHYVTIARQFGSQQWLKYDDTVVTAVTEEELKTADAHSAGYVLLYARSDAFVK